MALLHSAPPRPTTLGVRVRVCARTHVGVDKDTRRRHDSANTPDGAAPRPLTRRAACMHCMCLLLRTRAGHGRCNCRLVDNVPHNDRRRYEDREAQRMARATIRHRGKKQPFN